MERTTPAGSKTTPAVARPWRAAALLSFALLLSAVALHPARSASTVATENVEAALVAETDALVPGETAWLGLRLKMREGWHTYWRNPGDSGEATRIAWTLPEGIHAGEIHWPAPKRIPVGPLVNYGYEDDVLLPVPFRVSPEREAGGTATIRADASWLVCEEICVPESATLDLTLPVALTARPNKETAALFRETRKRLPVDAPGTARFREDGVALTLRAEMPGNIDARNAWFFPYGYGTVDFAGSQRADIAANEIALALPRHAAAKQNIDRLDGVLVVERFAGAPRVYEIAAEPSDAIAPLAPAAPVIGTVALWQAVLFALLGGMILNLTPCVFPVIFMKAAGLAAAHGSRARVRAHSLVFSAGVLTTFAVLAGALLAVRAGGELIGWGYQLQSPAMVALLALLFFALGLSLSGVFTLGERLMGFGTGLAARPGHGGAFFTGVLVVVVASPCTAPFMGVALGFAVTQSPTVAMAVFLSMGLGLALPYLALAVAPSLLEAFPRPGRWMQVVKEALAFPLYATSAWLLWVLVRQAGPEGLAAALGGAILIGLAAWLTRTLAGEARTGARRIAIAVLIIAALGLAVTAGRFEGEAAATAARTTTDSLVAEPWSPERVAALRAEGRPVFVNFTADWCITCLVNERMALSSPRVRDTFATRGIAYLKADWTRHDPRITAALAAFGRNGVPLYVFYPAAGGTPEVLPALLTEAAVLEALSRS